MDNNERLLDIAAGLYDAALDDARWPHALQQLCDFFASTAIYLFVIDHATGPVPFGVSYGFDRSRLAEYDSHYVKTDPGAAFSLAHPEIKFQYNYLHTPEAEMDRCEYHDWLHRVAGRVTTSPPSSTIPRRRALMRASIGPGARGMSIRTPWTSSPGSSRTWSARSRSVSASPT